MAGKARTVKKLDREELFQYGVSLLAARAQSAGEVRAKMRRKAADLSDIDGVIARLRECCFLDDSKFAEGFATARRGTFGAGRVLRDLRQRRVSAPVEEKNLASVYRKLVYAGFRPGAAIRVLKKFAARADELEETGIE
jgi:regulatory protein